MENFIQLKKSNVQRFGIKDADGNDTGEYIEFDIEDIDLAKRINDCQKKHAQNVRDAKTQFVIIDKKQDKKGKYLLSYNEEQKYKVLKEFYRKEAEALDLVLGENGTKKLLNGRKPYWNMYDDINEILQPIMPKLQTTSDDLLKK